MPALKLLVVYFCIPRGPSMPLVLEDDIRLSSLTYEDAWEIEMLTPLLAQAKGLKHLSISCRSEVTATDKTQRDLIRVIIMHKDTLRSLKLNETLALVTDLDARVWDSFMVKSIQNHCRGLVALSFPFVSNKPVSYYCELIAGFPNLESLTISENSSTIIWSSDSVLELFSASTRLQYVRFNDNKFEWGRRFLRQVLVKLWCQDDTHWGLIGTEEDLWSANFHIKKLSISREVVGSSYQFMELYFTWYALYRADVEKKTRAPELIILVIFLLY